MAGDLPTLQRNCPATGESLQMSIFWSIQIHSLLNAAVFF